MVSSQYYFFGGHGLNVQLVLVTLQGERLDASVVIPSNRFRPESIHVQMSIEAPNLSVDFSLPRWNTRAAYIPKEGCNLAKIRLLVLKASYLYYTETREDFVDHLTLNFEVSLFGPTPVC